MTGRSSSPPVPVVAVVTSVPRGVASRRAAAAASGSVATPPTAGSAPGCSIRCAGCARPPPRGRRRRPTSPVVPGSSGTASATAMSSSRPLPANRSVVSSPVARPRRSASAFVITAGAGPDGIGHEPHAQRRPGLEDGDVGADPGAVGARRRQVDAEVLRALEVGTRRELQLPVVVGQRHVPARDDRA